MRFEQTVKVILQTFAVFVGFTFTETIRTTFTREDNLSDWRWGALIALIALLLRFIIGSSVHLNRTFVPPPATNPLPQGQGVSSSVGMLLKDLIFLVLFGMAAVAMARATGQVVAGQASFGIGLKPFLWASMTYLALAAVWCGVDYVARNVLPWCGAQEKTAEVGSFSGAWLGLCLAQLAATGLLYWLLDATGSEGLTAWLLAFTYVICLYVDLKIILR